MSLFCIITSATADFTVQQHQSSLRHTLSTAALSQVKPDRASSTIRLSEQNSSRPPASPQLQPPVQQQQTSLQPQPPAQQQTLPQPQTLPQQQTSPQQQPPAHQQTPSQLQTLPRTGRVRNRPTPGHGDVRKTRLLVVIIVLFLCFFQRTNLRHGQR